MSPSDCSVYYGVSKTQTVIWLPNEMKRLATSILAQRGQTLADFMRVQIHQLVVNSNGHLFRQQIPPPETATPAPKNPRFASLDKEKDELKKLAFEIVINELRKSLEK
ncbi:MAG: hypothetical protein IJX22_05000 [Opitutales bacterium]|nr:hypothetical protein [Opitutales bacterium]